MTQNLWRALLRLFGPVKEPIVFQADQKASPGYYTFVTWLSHVDAERARLALSPMERQVVVYGGCEDRRLVD